MPTPTSASAANLSVCEPVELGPFESVGVRTGLDLMVVVIGLGMVETVARLCRFRLWLFVFALLDGAVGVAAVYAGVGGRDVVVGALGFTGAGSGFGAAALAAGAREAATSTIASSASASRSDRAAVFARAARPRPGSTIRKAAGSMIVRFK